MKKGSMIGGKVIKKLTLLIITIIALVIFIKESTNKEWTLLIIITLLMLAASILAIKTCGLAEELTYIVLFWIYRLYVFALVIIMIMNSSYSSLFMADIALVSSLIAIIFYIAMAIIACVFCGAVVAVIMWLPIAAILALVLELMGCHYIEPFNDYSLAASMSKVITRFRKNS